MRRGKAGCKMQNDNFELRTTNLKGFTLIEIVITIVLVSILSGIATLIILQGVKAYSSEDQRSDVHYQSRLAMERMAREIRLIRSRTAAPFDDIPTMIGTTLDFYDINNTHVAFRLNAGNIERQENGGAWQPLTRLTAPDNISGPGGNIFSYLDNAYVGPAAQANLWFVQIEFTSTRGSESLYMRTRVHPRNF